MLLLAMNVTLLQHLGTINEINWHFLVGRKKCHFGFNSTENLRPLSFKSIIFYRFYSLFLSIEKNYYGMV